MRLFDEDLSETNKNNANNTQVNMDCRVGRNTELENRTEYVSKFLDDTLRGNRSNQHRYEQRRSNQHSSIQYGIEVDNIARVLTILT